jgi:hypothetical protein
MLRTIRTFLLSVHPLYLAIAKANSAGYNIEFVISHFVDSRFKRPFANIVVHVRLPFLAPIVPSTISGRKNNQVSSLGA